MTESPPRLPASSPNDTPPQDGGGFGLGGMVLRLFFLGLVGIISTGAGVALAVFLPDRNPQAPFIEVALQNLRLTGETRIVPNISPTVVPNINNSPEVLPVSPAPASPRPSSSPNSTITPETSPANTEAAQLRQDLQQVQKQFKDLGDRTASLEQKLGISATNGSLETRLEKLSQQLSQSPTPSPTPLNTPKTSSPSPAQTIASSPSSTTTATPPPSNPISPNSPSPITYGIALQKKITLPTDSLFEGTSSTLRPESILLLSQVANELRGIAGSTVQVTVHSNLGGEPSNDRRLSFQQAKTIREYLATQLGDRFRFVAIGYGSTRPLLAPAERPENRRIEIIVE